MMNVDRIAKAASRTAADLDAYMEFIEDHYPYGAQFSNDFGSDEEWERAKELTSRILINAFAAGSVAIVKHTTEGERWCEEKGCDQLKRWYTARHCKEHQTS